MVPNESLDNTFLTSKERTTKGLGAWSPQLRCVLYGGSNVLAS